MENGTNGNTRKNNTALVGGKRRTRKAHGHTQTIGSKAQVFHGTAHHTSGGLTKKDLIQNKHGRIVSRRKAALGKKALKHLVKAGYKATRGKFVAFTKKAKKN